MDDSVLQDIAQRIRVAADHATPLRIRGGGSKDFYGEAATGEVLQTAPLAGICSYEPTELVVTVGAGTPLAQLEQLLASQGQCLPFEPPHFGGTDTGTATVGGMVAAGLSGPARASVGSVRDYVLGMTLVNGRGEILTFGGQVMKNVAGYDVSRLMVGSMGTLALIAQVSLKVLPVAPAQATLRFELDQGQALQQLQVWGGRPLPLNASLWSQEGGRSSLLLRLRGAVAAVESACRSLGGERLPQDQAQALWQACREQTLEGFSCGSRDLWRLSLPQTAPVLGWGEPPLIEWHGGLRWLRTEPGAGEALREVAAAVGGSATLFRRGAGTRTGAHTARFDRVSSAVDRIQRELKRQFDPSGIFNRGRLFAHD